MLDAFKPKEFDLEPVLEAWKNPPRFFGNPKKDPPVDTWLDQVKEGCLERKIPKECWHKVGQHFLADKARKRLNELQEVLRNLHGGNYRWDWKRFKIAMRNMGWDIDDKKTESVKVQTKSSGLWRIIGREKETVKEEAVEAKPNEGKKKPTPMRRATVGESSSPTEKELVKADPVNSSGFWKLHLPSTSSNNASTITSSNNASTTTTSTSTTSTSTAVVPVPPGPQPQGELTTTTVAQAPIWLLNACNALDFLTTEHPKVMTTLSAVLITVGSLPALPASPPAPAARSSPRTPSRPPGRSPSASASGSSRRRTRPPPRLRRTGSRADRAPAARARDVAVPVLPSSAFVWLGPLLLDKVL
ncbi:hypothetical protein BC827DRAFT_1321941 [Russula dissimulans]|nr:hypothetical protein BC827DRAFT_1321941 [Russula dissimulans]